MIKTKVLQFQNFGGKTSGAAGACGTDVRCAEGTWEERRGKGRRMRVQTGGDGAGDVRVAREGWMAVRGGCDRNGG